MCHATSRSNHPFLQSRRGSPHFGASKAGQYVTRTMPVMHHNQFSKEQLAVFLEQTVPDEHKGHGRRANRSILSTLVPKAQPPWRSATPRELVRYDHSAGRASDRRRRVFEPPLPRYPHCGSTGCPALPPSVAPVSSQSPLLRWDVRRLCPPRRSVLGPCRDLSRRLQRTTAAILARSDRQLRRSPASWNYAMIVSLDHVLASHESLVGRMFDWRNPGPSSPCRSAACSSGEVLHAGFASAGCAPRAAVPQESVVQIPKHVHIRMEQAMGHLMVR